MDKPVAAGGFIQENQVPALRLPGAVRPIYTDRIEKTYLVFDSELTGLENYSQDVGFYDSVISASGATILAFIVPLLFEVVTLLKDSPENEASGSMIGISGALVVVSAGVCRLGWLRRIKVKKRRDDYCAEIRKNSQEVTISPIEGPPT